MLPLTDWILEDLTLEKVSFRMVAVSGLLFLLLAVLFHFLLKGFGFCYHFYVTCQKLRCFPEPPRINWLLGHLDIMLYNKFDRKSSSIRSNVML
uniref:Uncharacterized protein n=1 Tax=Anolis carolinensis TaxID=28377 RepID=A0A803TDH0_ANOCA